MTGMAEQTTDWNDFITCPHCGDEDHEYVDYPRALKCDGDSATRRCSECGYSFRIVLSVSYSFQSTALPTGPTAAARP